MIDDLRQHRAGFSLTDMCVILITLVAIVGMVTIAAAEADEKAKRIACANNLRAMGQAMIRYANENKGSFPRTVWDAESAETVNFFTGWRASEPFGKEGPQANDVTAAMYLLLRTSDLTPKTFRCLGSSAKPIRFGFSAASQAALPGQTGEPDPVSVEAQKELLEKQRRDQPLPDVEALAVEPIARDRRDISNFPGAEYLGYSFANPYPTKRAISKGFRWSARASGDMIVAADMNPGGNSVVTIKFEQMPPPEPQSEYHPYATRPWKFSKEQRTANSPNHSGFGQNVLLVTGTVIWQPTPFCGASHRGGKPDNIYTRYLEEVEASEQGDPIIGPPMDDNDSVLLPTAEQLPTPASRPTTRSAISTDPVDPSAPEPQPARRRSNPLDGISTPQRK